MGSFASDLKTERERRKIPLSQIAADTRISLHYLKSLEEGRYGDLPGGMYNRAFLKAYCESLNLDKSEMLRRYEAEFPFSEKPAKSKTYIPQHKSSPRSSPIIVWSIMLLILAGVIYISRKWIADAFSPYFYRAPAMRMPIKSPPEPIRASSAAEIHTPALSPAAESSSQPDLPTTTSSGSSRLPLASLDASVHADTTSPERETAASLSGTAPPIRLELVITEECWVSLEHDGNRAVRRIMEPGEVHSLAAADYFFLVVGNAGGAHLKINDRPAKPIGKRGAVVKLLINRKNLPDLIDQTAG